jgi:hypothetical protein
VVEVVLVTMAVVVLVVIAVRLSVNQLVAVEL